MSKAIVEGFFNKEFTILQQDFPVIVRTGMIAIDVAPEEEYFLTSDGDGHDYIIPVSKKERFYTLLQKINLLSDPLIEDSFEEEFGEYRVEGDWDKEYKIVKR